MAWSSPLGLFTLPGPRHLWPPSPDGHTVGGSLSGMGTCSPTAVHVSLLLVRQVAPRKHRGPEFPRRRAPSRTRTGAKRWLSAPSCPLRWLWAQAMPQSQKQRQQCPGLAWPTGAVCRASGNRSRGGERPPAKGPQRRCLLFPPDSGTIPLLSFLAQPVERFFLRGFFLTD